MAEQEQKKDTGWTGICMVVSVVIIVVLLLIGITLLLRFAFNYAGLFSNTMNERYTVRPMNECNIQGAGAPAPMNACRNRNIANVAPMRNIRMVL